MKQKIIIVVFILLAVNSVAQRIEKLPYVIFKFDTNLPISFSANSKNASLDSFEIFKIDSFIALFIKDYNDKLYSDFYLQKKKNDSTLTKDQLDYIYSYSQISLKKNYKMQLVAITDSNGDKLVWVNCFCGDMADDYWQKATVTIDDGDNCFFELKINLSKNKYYDCFVHGG